MNQEPKDETVEDYLARGGKITVCPTLSTDEIIESMKPVYKEIMHQVDLRAGRVKKEHRV